MKLTVRALVLLLAMSFVVSMAACANDPATSEPADESSAIAESVGDEASSDVSDESVEDAESTEDTTASDEASTDDTTTTVTGDATNTTEATTTTKPTTTTTTTKKATTTTKPIDAKRDLTGVTITICDPWGVINKPGERGKSELRDARLDLYESIEKATGVKIENRSSGGYQEFQSSFQAAMLSNDFFADIIDAQLWQIRRWMRDGYLAELDKISTLNLKDEKFMASKSNLAYYDGHYYGTDFVTHCNYINFNGGAMLVNLDMMESKDIDIYKLIEDGQWTRKKFRELLKMFTYSKGGKKIDRWGACALHSSGMLWATGLRLAQWDGTKYVFGMNNSDAMSALQYMLDIQHEDQSVNSAWSASSSYYGATDLWGKERVAFYPIDMEWLTYGDEEESWFLDVDFNYGLIPYPNFISDTAKVNFKGQFYGETRLYSIPKTAAKSKDGHTLEDVGYVFDLMTEPLLGGGDYWKEYVKDNYFQGNEKSFNMYYKMLMNAELDHAVDMGAVQLIPWQTTIGKMGKLELTPAEAIEAEATAFQSYLNSHVNSDAKLLKSHK